MRVTWPFWTLFVLNPIVGIELPSTHCDEIQLTGWVRWYINLLDSELAALHPVSNSVRMENTWDLDIEDGGGEDGEHTANTRSSEDFPAF